MKKLILAVTLASVASLASAGSNTDPMMEPPVVVNDIEEGAMMSDKQGMMDDGNSFTSDTTTTAPEQMMKSPAIVKDMEQGMMMSDKQGMMDDGNSFISDTTTTAPEQMMKSPAIVKDMEEGMMMSDKQGMMDEGNSYASYIPFALTIIFSVLASN